MTWLNHEQPLALAATIAAHPQEPRQQWVDRCENQRCLFASQLSVLQVQAPCPCLTLGISGTVLLADF